MKRREAGCRSRLFNRDEVTLQFAEGPAIHSAVFPANTRKVEKNAPADEMGRPLATKNASASPTIHSFALQFTCKQGVNII